MAPKSQPHLAGTESPSLPTAATSSKEGSEAPTSSKQSRNASPSSATGVPPKRADSETAPGKATSTSQPMTKSSSSSSGSNPPDAKDAATGPSPYGTRSRGRTGRARPNYAEDKDIDSDLFDAASERKDDGDAKRSTRQANPSSATAQDNLQPGSSSSSSSSSRKPLPSSDDGKHGGSAAAATAPVTTTTTSAANKESQQQQQQNQASASATPTLAANPATASQTSKKRKAGNQGSSSTLNQQAAPGNASGSSGAAHRKSLVGGGGAGGASGYAETNMMSFEDCQGRPKNKTLTADDGTILAVNDHVYLICEPPGEPYYIARIMEFLHSKNDATRPVDSVRVNWFYRPKDIGRKAQDTRMLFATMHSDICPLNSLRGKCTVRHKAEIPNAEAYRRSPDCFWWDKMYDRYIQKNYDAIPTSQIINVPERVKKVLDERWKYILVEQGRGKELTSAVKSCKRCSGYCASADSVDCGFCKNTYHMQCVRPPLQKKPARGFGWACGPCNLAQERKLEALNAPHLHHDSASHVSAEDEELLEEEEEEDPAQANTNRTSPDVEHDHPPPTQEQIYQASLWPYRYLGMHCKLEDALDYDDRIYPRASSRLGPRHQATVGNWPGRPVEFVKSLEIKKTGRKDGRHSKEIQALLEKEKREREKRPKWVQDEPFSGFVPRGLDLDEDDPNATSTCLWKPAEDADGEPVKDADNDLIISEAGIDDYMDRARSMTKELGLPDRCTNLEDIARDLLYKNNYDAEGALRQLAKTDKSLFKEPELTAAEQKKFEEAVAKFGSELQSVRRLVKSVPHKWIVRHYYKWKKTAQGKKIWGNHPQRKGKKEIKRAQAEASKAADEVADDHDDSAFDTVKAKDRKKNFMCKFCNTRTSRQWRRAPNVSSAVVIENGGKNKDKGTPYVVALCRRCAELWRRYAIQWEDLDEAAKKLASSGNRSFKKKIDEELYKELQAADERMRATKYSSPEPSVPPPNAAAATAAQTAGPQEPPRKKLKSERDPEPTLLETGPVGSATVTKKKEKEKPVEKPAPPPPPPMPKPKTMPCSICRQLEPLGDQHLQCRECRMTVHRNCYGVVDNRQNGRWICDMCSNDRNPQISLHYKCVLCPVERTEHDFVEPPKISHKKKSEKERERERVEKESAQKAADFYRKLQEELGRPVDPREPLKRTADNNWVHVTCAVFTPEVKFANAKALEPSEGIPSIPRSRYQEVCKVCKQQGGACVPCHNPTCRTTFHVECAYQQGYAVGFDITPVKGSRRDQHNIVTIGGESGTMTAAIWCKDHVPKSVIHHIEDVVDESGLNALQLYVRNFKQADLALSGCARKANLIPAAARPVTASTTTPVNRRASTTTLVPATSPVQVNGAIKEEVPYIMQPAGKVCITCGTDVSPKWHSIDESQGLLLVNGHGGSLGEEAQKFVAQRNYQCHKCKKANRRVEPQPVVKQETSPPPVEAVRSPPPAIQATASPQNLMSVRNIAPQPWDRPPRQSSLDAPAAQPPPMAATSHGPAFGPPPGPIPVQAPAPITPTIAPPIAAPMVQAPQQQTQPPPLAQPIAAPSLQSALPPRGPPSHQYPPPHTPPYGEWRRPSSQHGSHPPPPPPPPSQPHHMNGTHSQIPPSTVPPLAPPNHLRPPPLSGIPPPPPPPPPLQNSHGHSHHYGHQPAANGMPPSPRGMGGPPPLTNGGPYLPQHHQPHPVHHQPPPPPHHLTNGGPPPRAAEHPFSHGLHPQRSPFSTPHGSPPVTRDTVMVGRETSMPPRAPDNRQPSGASASPSLRNLLH